MRRIRTLSLMALCTALGVGGTLVTENFQTAEKQIVHPIRSPHGVGDPQFARTAGTLIGPPLVAGNRVTGLYNGDQIFPAMLEAIAHAQKSITFETYIYWSGAIGRRLAHALAERARAGVKVHVLLDWVGAGKMDRDALDELRTAGGQIEKFHPLSWYHLDRMNNRTHRKLLVIDGRIGFTGGVGIADPWLGDADAPDRWRDSHYRIEGPAVLQMQAAFMDNWLKTRREVLHGDDYFPAIEPAGSAEAQVTLSGFDDGSESVRLLYLFSLASAKRSIRLSTAYFVPDPLAIDTLVAARQRGVKVTILVPGPYLDSQVTRKASKARWGRLLAAGVEIFEYQPAMLHCKVLIVDELWVSVGSTNFDERSFRLNAEANLNVRDAAFAVKEAAVFDADLARSRPIAYEAWKRRPWTQKLGEHAASLLGSQL